MTSAMLLQWDLKAENDRLRGLCACAYQFAGVHDAPVEWLDALSDAANGQPFSTDGLLPYMPQAVCDAETENGRLRAEVETVRGLLRKATACAIRYVGAHESVISGSGAVRDDELPLELQDARAYLDAIAPPTKQPEET